VCLRTIEGLVLDRSPTFLPARPESRVEAEVKANLQALRFLNCEMYYTDEEIELLLRSLEAIPLDQRASFFDCCQRLRRRERQVWGDTPLAKVFTAQSDWKHLHVRSLVHQLGLELQRRQLGSNYLVQTFGEASDGRDRSVGRSSEELAPRDKSEPAAERIISVTALQRMCIHLKLGFSPADISLIAQAIDEKGEGVIGAQQLSRVLNIAPDATPQPKCVAGGSGGGGGDGKLEGFFAARSLLLSTDVVTFQARGHA
jgi:hypothetical protein